jgi:hypothetical protein
LPTSPPDLDLDHDHDHDLDLDHDHDLEHEHEHELDHEYDANERDFEAERATPMARRRGSFAEPRPPWRLLLLEPPQPALRRYASA